MKTTLTEIFKHNPSEQVKQKFLNTTDSIDFMTILETVGIENTIWCLRTQDYKDYCLFLADVAESVLPIFDAKNIKEPWEVVEGIRAWYNRDINTKELRILANAAFDAAYADTYGYGYETYAAAAYAAGAAGATVYATIRAAVNAGADWGKIEELFIKHFGE